MHRLRSVLFAAMLTLGIAPVAPAAAEEAADKMSPALARAFSNSPTGRVEMLIVMAEQADLAPARELAGKAAKGRFVFERLTATAKRSQAPLLAELARLGVPQRSFWAANFVWVEGDFALAQNLAARGDVARLDTNPRLILAEPTVDPDARLAEVPDAVEWNISWVNADDVWLLGHNGQGAVIAGQDTGYLWNHPALVDQYRGWNGSAANHNYNWHDAIHSGGGSCGPNSVQPCDDHGHGTHTMGTMVGDDGGANQVGMAPGARWIGCRNMDVGVGTPTTYIECFQWFIAPTDLAGQNPDPAMAPDVINNSWGCPADEGCNPGNFAVMQLVVENVRAGGTFVAVSAGNDGSGCSSVNTPAAIYDASFSVGATSDHSDAIAGFSSRGPVTVDGSNRMKPDIAAPGSNIRSSTRDGSYQGGWDGTSMAGPHVAGLVGLMISAVPAVAGDVTRIEDLIRQSAFHPSFGGECGVGSGIFPNNTFGAGRIDALAAVNLLLSQADFQITVTPGSQAVCAPASALFDVTIGQLGAFSEPVTLSAAGNPAGSAVDFAPNPVTPPGAATMTVTTAGVAAGSSPITVTGTSSPSGVVRDDVATLAVFTAGAAAPTLSAPANGAINVPAQPTFTWSPAAGAADYLLEVDDSVNFSSPVYTASLTAASHTPGSDLPSNTLLYWRVTANNPCAPAVSGVFSFTTVALPGDCATGSQPEVHYSYGFESGAGGWTHSGTGDSWAVAATAPHSGTSHFHANDPTAVSDQRLVSPAVVLPSGQDPVVLKFWHVPDLEPSGATACYDGGILEVSTNGGTTWTQVPGANLLVGPYTGAVSGSFGNPLAGLEAWCGTTSYIQTIADVSAYAGQTAQFRLRLGSDTSVTNPGWNVDDVVVQSCVFDPMPFLDGFESNDTSAWSFTAP